MKSITLFLLHIFAVPMMFAVTITAPGENITIGDVIVPRNGGTQASSAPDVLPINEGARKAYLLSMATVGKLRYVGEGIVSTPAHRGEVTLTLNNETSATPAALLTQLMNSRVSVGVANPDRSVTAICELLDQNGTILLSGQAPAEVVPNPRVSGGYSIEQLESIVLRCQNSIPIQIPGAESIEIVSRDEDGNLNYTDQVYPDENNTFNIWTWSYRYGEVIVNFEDGSQAFYSFTTGERQDVTATVEKKNFTISNYVEQTVAGATATSVVTVSMNVIYERGEFPSPPTYRIKVTKPAKLRIQVTCQDTDENSVRPPTEWWYHRDDDVDEFMVPHFESFDENNGTASFIITVKKAGVYWINAEGPEFRKNYWPQWRGEKG